MGWDPRHFLSNQFFVVGLVVYSDSCCSLSAQLYQLSSSRSRLCRIDERRFVQFIQPETLSCTKGADADDSLISDLGVLPTRTLLCWVCSILIVTMRIISLNMFVMFAAAPVIALQCNHRSLWKIFSPFSCLLLLQQAIEMQFSLHLLIQLAILDLSDLTCVLYHQKAWPSGCDIASQPISNLSPRRQFTFWYQYRDWCW